jgi:hypothetical protein
VRWYGLWTVPATLSILTTVAIGGWPPNVAPGEVGPADGEEEELPPQPPTARTASATVAAAPVRRARRPARDAGAGSAGAPEVLLMCW